MSHFTLLIPADNEGQLAMKMAPFYEQYHPDQTYTDIESFETAVENGWVIWNDEYERFVDEYNSDEKIIPAVSLPNESRLVHRYDDRFKSGLGGYELPEGAVEIKVAPRVMYDTFEEFIADWHGYKDPEKPVGYWYNPNAKWDWWVIGGRWMGMLKLKNTNGERPVTAGRGEPGVFGPNEDSMDYNSADTALVKDVNWDAMRDEDYMRELHSWNLLHEGLEEASKFPSIEKLVEASQSFKKYNRLTIDTLTAKRGHALQYAPDIWDTMYQQAKFEYAVVYMQEEREGLFLFIDYDRVRELLLPLDEFRSRVKTPAQTFAFIDLEGKWNERGDMGWFGIVSDKNPDYDKVWWDFIGTLDPDQRIYIVDCHI